MRKRSFYILELTLVLASSIAGFLLVNLVYILWIRSPLQRDGFPRQLVADLPAPNRWLYPDTGRTNSSEDIALIGDSYVEGSSDDYGKGIYKYGIGHYLYEFTGQPIASFGTGGSHLSRQVKVLDSAFNGNYWPLFDPIARTNRPKHYILFFYEGNDLEDLKASLKDPLKARVRMPYKLRFFPIIRLIERRLENLRHRVRDRLSIMHQKRVESICKSQTDCIHERTLKPIQGPSMEFTDREITSTLNILKADLKEFSNSHKGSKICLVYIPSPVVASGQYSRTLESYKIGSNTRPNAWNSNEIYHRHLSIRNYVSTIARANGYIFVDSTNALRAAAKTTPIYGDQDINHLNRIGYKIIAQTITSSKSCITQKGSRL